MWIPKSESEILAAIEAGDLTETSTFDAKAALPAKGKAEDLAICVAAMATDGGTLLYGVGEDEDDRPSVPQPFRLAGARERVDQIVRTSISESPDVQVREIPTDDDPSLGYLVVAVPPSARAPHIVTVGKEYRYYGRSDTGNVPLTEGEVARLYERRQSWEVDREKLLDEAIENAPIEPKPDFAYLHFVAHPVVPDEDLLNRAKGDRHVADFLNGLFSTALSEEVWPRTYGEKGYSPDMADSNPFELPGKPIEGYVRVLAATDGANKAGQLSLTIPERLRHPPHVLRRGLYPGRSGPHHPPIVCQPSSVFILPAHLLPGTTEGATTCNRRQAEERKLQSRWSFRLRKPIFTLMLRLRGQRLLCVGTRISEHQEPRQRPRIRSTRWAAPL